MKGLLPELLEESPVLPVHLVRAHTLDAKADDLSLNPSRHLTQDFPHLPR